MKLTKIFSTTVVALGAVLALSGCIRETFPKESTITEGQLMSGQMDVVAGNLIKGVPSAMMYVALGSEHCDFGYHSMGGYNDHACQLICTNGWTMGQAPAYNRFYPAAWGRGYAENGYMASFGWYSYYPIIKNCNDVIKLVEGNDDLKHYSAVARTYRALFYLDLARLYECLYANVDNGGDGYANQQILVAGLTVPIVNENTTEEAATDNPRATREEMFKFIFEDLAFAESVFSGDYTPSAPTDPTLAVVYGLYARAYLWLGGFNDGLSGELPESNAAYQKAAEYARLAITAFGGAIMNESEWTNPVTGFNTKASSWMWTLFHSTDTVINNLYQFPAHFAPEADYGYAPLTCPGVSKLSYERLSNTDFRKKLMKGPENSWEQFKAYTLLNSIEEYNNFADYTFFKFRPGQGNRTEYKTAGAVSLPLMRCEEMYFIEMEAMAHYNEAAAWELLYTFMASRDSNYACLTQDLVDEIIFQKGIEFWGEGLLMFDMKRLDMGVNSAFPGTNYDEQRRFKTEGRVPWWTYCIPQGEMQLNTALSGKNNPDPSNSLKTVK